jgi:hypothetical protein
MEDRNILIYGAHEAMSVYSMCPVTMYLTQMSFYRNKVQGRVKTAHDKCQRPWAESIALIYTNFTTQVSAIFHPGFFAV